jgi:hypothetical protein
MTFDGAVGLLVPPLQAMVVAKMATMDALRPFSNILSSGGKREPDRRVQQE